MSLASLVPGARCQMKLIYLKKVTRKKIVYVRLRLIVFGVSVDVKDGTKTWCSSFFDDSDNDVDLHIRLVLLYSVFFNLL